MTEYQLEQYCDRHSLCDCDCMNCPGFAAYWRGELGLDEIDEDCEEEYGDSGSDCDDDEEDE